MPRLARVLRLLGALSPENMRFIEFARRHQIRWADATRRIPVPDRSVDAIYSSHMISYLDQPRITRFLAEARRVLKPGGVIRLAAGYHTFTFFEAIKNFEILLQLHAGNKWG